MCDYHTREAAWAQEQDLLLAVRERVFVQEQGVPRNMERDALDASAYHVLAENLKGDPIGAGRLLADGRIGRMCVLMECRGDGVGTSVLSALLTEAKKRGLDQVTLLAQTHAEPFYARFGFVAIGASFEEAGITHRAMQLVLDRREGLR